MIAQIVLSVSNIFLIAAMLLKGAMGNPGVNGPKFSYLYGSSQAPEAVMVLPQKFPSITTTLA